MVKSCHRNKGTAIISTAVIFLFAVSAAAEEGPEESYPNDITSLVRFAPARSAKDSSGTVATLESETEYSYEFTALDRLPVTVSLANRYVGIRNTAPLKLPAHLIGLSADIETILPFFSVRDTYLGLGITPSFYSGRRVFEASAFRLPSRSFIAYRPRPEWTFVGGVEVYPEYEETVFPIAGLIYEPNEKLQFNLVSDNPNIRYEFTKTLALFVEGDFYYDEYEVDKGALKDVTLKYEGLDLGGGVEYKLNKYVRAAVSMGAALDRSLKYKDGEGKLRIKDGFYIEAAIEAGF